MAQSALLTVMVNAVRKAGRALVRDFGEIENLQVSPKGPGDFVTNADKKAEKILYEELSKARPAWGFLMEESGSVEGQDKQHRWIIDPLDGTINFMHGLPLFAVNVALERAGVIQAAVTYNPIYDELFTAERGSGAFCNDRRMRVAGRRRMEDAIVATGIPHLGRGNHPAYLQDLAGFMSNTSGIRRTGAAAIDLAWTAMGRLDGYWEVGIHPWDIAAGILLVREAGGFVSDIHGRDKMFETGTIVVGNEHMHQLMLKKLADTSTV